ncbi:MAG: TRAP transporter small permease [Planctomycetaceae bacterium]|nr:TRAP transporter small permease [Planctomycetaceae bacterium]
MAALNRFLSNVEKYICVTTFVVMLFLTFINIVSRYLLTMSLSFTKEIVTGLFVIASLAGSSIAIRDHSHLGLDFITSYFSKGAQRFLFVIANLLGIVFCAVVLYHGAIMVYHEWESGQVSATMQWPEWIYGMTVPVGALLLMLRYGVTIWQTVAAAPAREGQA